MIKIFEASVNDFKIIQDIAYKTWPVAYKDILSEEQLKYMLDLFYSEKALSESISQKGHQFLLAFKNGIALGFVGIEHNFENNNRTRIHKLYILPESQNLGIGRILMNEVESLARAKESSYLSLNVNRFNKALYFYQKLGFEIVLEENIELGFGYLMEDFRMEKKILK